MTDPKLSWLFDTHALKIAPADSPFWLTSGGLSPYYINTQFLCGGEQKAGEILAFIDAHQDQRQDFPALMMAELEKVAATHTIYAQTLQALAELAREKLPLGEVDYVSGGQRRDWFFAPMIAAMLGKPCLYIYNDLSIIDSTGAPVTGLDKARVMNVADLLTVGSSYVTKWIPAVGQLGGRLTCSLNGVDRKQGGVESLGEAGIEHVVSLFAIDNLLFDEALQQNHITPEQHHVVMGYLSDPFKTMRDFLVLNPEFLTQALASQDPKTQKRAALLKEKDLYQLNKV